MLLSTFYEGNIIFIPKPNKDYKKKKITNHIPHEHKAQKSLIKDNENYKRLLQKHQR